MCEAEGGAVGCALLKNQYYLIKQSHGTHFTITSALFTLTYCLATLELLACNIARKIFMRIIGNDKSIK